MRSNALLPLLFAEVCCERRPRSIPTIQKASEVMKHSLLWPAILAGVSPILAAQDEVVRPGSLCPQGSAEVVGATEAAANLLPRLVTPIHTAADDPDGGAYGTWAAGQDYKVSFHGAPTFVPYLGADYPHNQPLTWHLESVTAG